jgi:hypothetical protein
MNYDSGEFICPKCRNNTEVYCTLNLRSNINQYFINNNSTHFKYYLSREEYAINGLQKKWIFYQSINHKWECCKCCLGEECHRLCIMSFFCCNSYGCNGSVIFLPCSSIIYILFFFWIDLIYYFCCSNKNKEYSGIKGRFNSNNNKFDNYEEIFYKIGGLSEHEWNFRYNAWVCSKCKFCAKTFLEFIPNSENKIIQYENINEANYIKLNVNNNETSRNEDDIIAIHFMCNSKDINFSFPCKKTDLFKSVLEKLFKEYSSLEKQNCYYICNGNIIDINKTCAENKINTGGKILIEFCD